jgi:hypothetical protein
MKRMTDPFLAGLLSVAVPVALLYFIHYLGATSVPELGWFASTVIISMLLFSCYAGLYFLVALPVFHYATACRLYLGGFSSATFGALTFGLAGALMALLAQVAYSDLPYFAGLAAVSGSAAFYVQFRESP